jgi:hypothetical protein
MSLFQIVLELINEEKMASGKEERMDRGSFIRLCGWSNLPLGSSTSHTTLILIKEH